MRKRIFAPLSALATLAAVSIVTGVTGPASPAAAALGLYRVTAVSALNGTSPKTATATCNAGDDLLGVGGRINDGNGDVLLTRAIADAALTTGSVSGIEAIATATPWSVEAIIVCAPGGAVTNLQLETTTVGPSVFDKTALASCDVGQKVYGAGFWLDNANGAIVIDEVRFDTNLDFVSVQSYDYSAAPNYSLTGQAICGDPSPIHERKTHVSASNAFSPKTETVDECPVGSDVSGVGGVITGALGAVGLEVLNTPPQLDTVQVQAKEVSPYGTNWTVEAQSICVG